MADTTKFGAVWKYLVIEYHSYLMGASVAEWVRALPGNLEVGGSNPTRGIGVLSVKDTWS